MAGYSGHEGSNPSLSGSAAQLDALFVCLQHRAFLTEGGDPDKLGPEQLDPLNREIAMPPDVEAKPEALQPFMAGWNVYGPRGW